MISILSNTFPATIDGYGYGLEAVDGDPLKVTAEDVSVDFGYTYTLFRDWFSFGRRVRRDHLPTRWRAINSSGRPTARSRIVLPDYDVSRRASIVSQAFRDIVERFEPGVHQFEPTTIVFAKGEEAEGPFYIMVPCQRVLIALDPDLTQPPMIQLEERPELVKPDPSEPVRIFKIGANPATWAPVFRRQAVAGKHLFCCAELVSFILVSGDLRQALETAGLTGLKFIGPYPLTDG